MKHTRYDDPNTLTLSGVASLLGVNKSMAARLLEQHKVAPCDAVHYESGGSRQWWNRADIEALKQKLEVMRDEENAKRLALMMPRESVRVDAPPVVNGEAAKCGCDNLIVANIWNGSQFVCWRCLGGVTARRVPVRRLVDIGMKVLE